MKEQRLIITLKSDIKDPGTKFGEKHDSFYGGYRVRRLWIKAGNQTTYVQIPSTSDGQEVKTKHDLTKSEYDNLIKAVPTITVFADMYEYNQDGLRMYYEKISTRKRRGLAKHVWSTEIETSRPTWKKQLAIMEKSFEMTNLGETPTRKMCEAIHKGQS